MECTTYKKWNYVTHSYDDYYVPVDKTLISWSADLNIKVNCCQCLKEIDYSDSYTSLEVHTDMGMGYAVCEDCYNQELIRRDKFRETVKDITEPKSGGVCCFCGEEIEGFGNNPQPLKNGGRCCDKCNAELVIPERLKLWSL